MNTGHWSNIHKRCRDEAGKHNLSFCLKLSFCFQLSFCFIGRKLWSVLQPSLVVLCFRVCVAISGMRTCHLRSHPIFFSSFLPSAGRPRGRKRAG